MSTVSLLSQVIYINLHLTSIGQAETREQTVNAIQNNDDLKLCPLDMLDANMSDLHWMTAQVMRVTAHIKETEKASWVFNTDSVFKIQIPFHLSIHGRYSNLNSSFYYQSKFRYLETDSIRSLSSSGNRTLNS